MPQWKKVTAKWMVSIQNQMQKEKIRHNWLGKRNAYETISDMEPKAFIF